MDMSKSALRIPGRRLEDNARSKNSTGRRGNLGRGRYTGNGVGHEAVRTEGLAGKMPRVLGGWDFRGDLQSSSPKARRQAVYDQALALSLHAIDLGHRDGPSTCEGSGLTK
jgi:hypothetical protein